MQKRPIKKSEPVAEVPREAPPVAPAAEVENPAERLNKAREAWAKHQDATTTTVTHHHEPASHHSEPHVPPAMGQYGFPGHMSYVNGSAPLYPYPMGAIPMPQPAVAPAPEAKTEQPQQKMPWPTTPPQSAFPVQGQMFDSLGKLMQMGVTFATTALSGSMQMLQGMGALQRPVGESHQGHYRGLNDHHPHGEYDAYGYDEHNRYHDGNNSCGKCGCSHVNGC